MSGNNGNNNDGYHTDDSEDSWFHNDEEVVFNPKTHQNERATGALVSQDQRTKEMLFSDVYKSIRASQESAEQKLRDAVKAKVDSITLLLQEQASKSSYSPSEQSASSEVGNQERPLAEVEKEINALISDIRRQYISNARREEQGITVLDHSMMAVLLQLQRGLKGTSYGDMLDKFMEEEIVENSILISKGDSSDAFLHHIYQHPDDKSIIGEEIFIQYRDAVDEYFISNSDSNLTMLNLAETAISNVLGSRGGPRITAMSVALATALESRIDPKTKPASRTRLE